MSEAENQSFAVELKAMQAIVRAIARTVAVQSPNGLADLLSCLQIEVNRLAVISGEGDVTGHRVVEALSAWTENLMQGTPDLGDVEARDASGRPVHFLD